MRTVLCRWRQTAGASATLLAVLPAAGAQQAPRPIVRQTVATNPLLPILGAVSGEYERAVGTQGLAVGVGGWTVFGGALSNLGFESSVRDYYTSAHGKLKYYPAQDGVRGFAVGATAGLLHHSTRADGSTRATSYTAPTLGMTLDYNWLPGRRRPFLVGVGAGARRVFPSGAARGNLARVVVDPRFQLGIGF